VNNIDSAKTFFYEKVTMNVTYERPPIEGRPFHVSASDVDGSADFRAYLNGEIIWSHRCPDPPCHEQVSIPENVAGSTLLIVVTDNQEERELTFFINDEGEGVPMRAETRELVGA
jgi:hypothetical protein